MKMWVRKEKSSSLSRGMIKVAIARFWDTNPKEAEEGELIFQGIWTRFQYRFPDIAKSMKLGDVKPVEVRIEEVGMMLADGQYVYPSVKFDGHVLWLGLKQPDLQDRESAEDENWLDTTWVALSPAAAEELANQILSITEELDFTRMPEEPR